MDTMSQTNSLRSPDNNGATEIPLYNITRLSYTKALSLQLELHDKVVAAELPGALILLEHDPVITKGVKTGPANVLVSPQALESQGIELVDTDRGGDVTYHGPGQLVGYPILPIRKMGGDLHAYLRQIEQCIIDVLAGFGLDARRDEVAGVWISSHKVCSIGVAIRKWVAYHGFALNVDPNMDHFRLINPCGLASDQLTSLKELLGYAPPMDEVRAACAKAFEHNFGIKLIDAGAGT